MCWAIVSHHTHGKGTFGVPTSCPQCTCYRHYYWFDSLFLLPGTHMVCGAKVPHWAIVPHHTCGGGTSGVQHCFLCTLAIPTQYMTQNPIREAVTNLTMVMSEAYVTWLLPRSDIGIRMLKSGWVLLEVRTLIWTASGMRYWKGMIKITDNIDYYYCIIKVPCSLLAWYYLCATVINF